MLTLTGTLKSIFGWRTTTLGRSAARRNDPAATAQRDQNARATQVTEASEEQVFLASIAQLPAEERQKRIAKREWYRQLAVRQGIIEAEHQAAQNLWK